MGVQTTFTCVLGNDEAGSHLTAGIDTRPEEKGGMNAQELGKTNGFVPGDKIAFLVFHSENVKVSGVKDIITTMEGKASISFHGSTSIEIEETLKFSGENRTVNLQKPTKNLIEKKWIGNNLESHFSGVLSVEADGVTVKLPPLPHGMKISENDSETSARAKRRQTKKPGRCHVKYKTSAFVFKLQTPTESQMEKYGKPPYEMDIVVNGD